MFVTVFQICLVCSKFVYWVRLEVEPRLNRINSLEPLMQIIWKLTNFTSKLKYSQLTTVTIGALLSWHTLTFIHSFNVLLVYVMLMLHLRHFLLFEHLKNPPNYVRQTVAKLLDQRLIIISKCGCIKFRLKTWKSEDKVETCNYKMHWYNPTLGSSKLLLTSSFSYHIFFVSIFFKYLGQF